MTATPLNPSPIGGAYRFASIASAGDEIWVCFGRSTANAEIYRLAPACGARLVPDAVKVRSIDEVTRWLVPGVEIAVHALDLGPYGTGERYKICSEDDAPQEEAKTADMQTVEDGRSELCAAALNIEARFLESGEADIPTVDDCRLESIDPGAAAARFRWRPDLSRAYRVVREGGQWSIFQRYDASQVVAADALVPLRVGTMVLPFTEAAGSGVTAISPEVASAALSALGLEYLPERDQLRLRAAAPAVRVALPISGKLFGALAGAEAQARSAIREVTHRLVVWLGAAEMQVHAATSFSTSDQLPEERQRALRFEWNGDLVSLLARSNPAGNKVQITIWIDTPESVRHGARFELRLGALNIPPIDILLTDRGGRLQGQAIIPISWEEFTSARDTPFELLMGQAETN